MESLGDFVLQFDWFQTEVHALYHAVRLGRSDRAITFSADCHDWRLYVSLGFPAPEESEESWKENIALYGRRLVTLEQAVQSKLPEKEAKRVTRRIGRWINADNPAKVASRTADILPYLPLLLEERWSSDRSE